MSRRSARRRSPIGLPRHSTQIWVEQVCVIFRVPFGPIPSADSIRQRDRSSAPISSQFSGTG